MTLHIFNPEHDIALASNLERFTPPHAARELRADLGFLPALWARDGDMVLVDDVEGAIESVRHLKKYVHEVAFVTPEDLSKISQCGISVWGWDAALRFSLIKSGIDERSLPTSATISKIRETSNRRWAAEHLLPFLTEGSDMLTGSSRYVTSLSELEAAPTPYVLKAPWSSSGRGIRYVGTLNTQTRNWASNIIKHQGGIMIEPYYNKVKDFALEFRSTGECVKFAGLSLFDTSNGAYTGNIIASEHDKRQMIGKYISTELIDFLADKAAALLSEGIGGFYSGPLGIDMMIVAEGGKLKVHPCVELNLRRTMGFAALAFNAKPTDPWRRMQVSYDGKYHLRVVNTNENLVNNGLV